jgi:hypothetical protein
MWYRTGTITLTQGSKVVTGDLTNWITQQSGWILFSEQSASIYEIDAIVSSTEATLVEPFDGTTAAELSYAIIPTMSLNVDLAIKINTMLRSFTESRDYWAAVIDDFNQSTYALWLEQGNEGTIDDFLAYLIGPDGVSSYDIWLELGNTGTKQEYLDEISSDIAAIVAADAQAAADSETAARTSENAAANSETAAGTSETNAAASETAAANSETAAGTSETNASASETNADASETAAGISETNAGASETAAGASETAAATSETNAATSEGLAQQWSDETEDIEVTTGLYSAKHHAFKAAASALAASTDLSDIEAIEESLKLVFDNFDDRMLGSFTTANEPTTDNDGNAILVGAMYYNEDVLDLYFWAGSEWKAPAPAAEAAAAAALASQNASSTSETNAAASETAAANSETAAGTSETNASASETNASASETAAGTSETNAAASETAAGTSETNASASETAAGISETNAAASETAAANSETAAGTSETNASASETAAGTSETNASAAETATVAARDDFFSKYIGSYVDDTAAINSGYTIEAGLFYWSTGSSGLRIYDGTNWTSAVLDTNGALVASNNLSEVDPALSRGNLELGTVAITDASDYATAAQGTLADDALPITGGILTGNLTISNTSPTLYIDETDDGAEHRIISAGGTLYIQAQESGAASNNGRLVLSGRNAVDLAKLNIDATETIFAVNDVDKLQVDVNGATVTGDLGVTGDLDTTGDVVSGRGSGGVALTINDSQGNANVTFNHQDGVPEQLGNGGRIHVNTDATASPTMHFEIGSAVTAGVSYSTTTIMYISNAGLTVTGTVNGRDMAADGTKLNGIETNADVTDTANVAAAGALMDDEVTNLAQVKAFNTADYAPVTHEHSGENITSGTIDRVHLGSGLSQTASYVTGGDWNNVVSTGWYMGSNHLNDPLGTNSGWYIGECILHNASWQTQTLHAFTSDTSTDLKVYRRSQNNGNWSDWIELRLGKLQQDNAIQTAINSAASAVIDPIAAAIIFGG